MGDSVHGETRMLAGPVAFFRSHTMENIASGAVGVAILLPCIFAVGVWRNPGTIVLAFLAGVCWVGIGVWLEVIAG